MKRPVFTLAALLAAVALIGFSASPALAGDHGSKKEEKAVADGQVRTVIPVEGMSCAACAKTVRTAVKKLDGVIEVEVDPEKGSATVVHEKGKPSVDDIVAAINKTGFKASAPKA